MPSTLTQEVEVDFGQLTNATCIGVDALGQFAALGSRAHVGGAHLLPRANQSDALSRCVFDAYELCPRGDERCTATRPSAALGASACECGMT